MKSVKREPSSVEVGSDISEQHMTLAERDDDALARLGKKPVLKRNFGFMSMLGFSCTVMITWEGMLLLFAVGFTNGGYAGSIYGFIIVWIGTLAVFTTMGELASMAPTSGGQYHWVSMLAPPSVQKFSSYLIGWITVIGWQAAVASGGFLCASLIQGLIGLNYPEYVAHPWQNVLLFYATLFFGVFINTVVVRALPKIEGIILIFHVLGFFAILIPLVYMAPHGEPAEIFTTFLNGGAFDTQGLSFMVGLVGPVFCLLGADSAVHMSEEIQNAAVIVPRAMIFSIGMNGIMGLGMLIATLFCIGDVDTVLSAPYAFMAIFQQAVGSAKGATAMSAVITVLMICALISFVATGSRMTWSFARDRGLPGWYWLSKVDQRTSIPLISIGLTTGIACLLALIILGSAVAFNDVVSLTINGLYTSYLIGNSLLLYRRVTGGIRPYNSINEGLSNVAGSDSLTWGPFRIPEPLGTIINAFGCVFMVIILFFSFWPTVMDPELSVVNFSSVMMVGTMTIACIYYLVWGKKSYTGPVIEIN
ncbi:amino acid transporter-like protein [Amylocarpus encephaloides]|uniref:Amino acid transporter-like protein n=1 Tax=Amylocarpus encephaloides TaxID=45428 RepID=A0A9P7YHD3_9HELO|nr:amino acid transporter-like protein [Amylocarpus encephaloides]